MIPAHEAGVVHGIQPSGSTSNYPPLIRRQSRNHWLNNRLLVQLVRSDQHVRACPAITSISHAEGHWFDPSRDHKKRRGQQLFGGPVTAGDCVYPPESAVGWPSAWLPEGLPRNRYRTSFDMRPSAQTRNGWVRYGRRRRGCCCERTWRRNAAALSRGVRRGAMARTGDWSWAARGSYGATGDVAAWWRSLSSAALRWSFAKAVIYSPFDLGNHPKGTPQQW